MLGTILVLLLFTVLMAVGSFSGIIVGAGVVLFKIGFFVFLILLFIAIIHAVLGRKPVPPPRSGRRM